MKTVKTLAIIALIAVLGFGAWAAHSAIGSMQQSITTHAARSA